MKRILMSLVVLALAATAGLAEQWFDTDVAGLMENAPDKEDYPDASALFLKVQETTEVATGRIGRHDTEQAHQGPDAQGPRALQQSVVPVQHGAIETHADQRGDRPGDRASCRGRRRRCQRRDAGVPRGSVDVLERHGEGHLVPGGGTGIDDGASAQRGSPARVRRQLLGHRAHGRPGSRVRRLLHHPLSGGRRSASERRLPREPGHRDDQKDRRARAGSSTASPTSRRSSKRRTCPRPRSSIRPSSTRRTRTGSSRRSSSRPSSSRTSRPAER